MSNALGGSPARSFEAESYDGRTILFHWLTVILVAGQWLGAHAIDWFPRGPLRVDARSTHIVVGSLLALLVLVRLTWRFSGGRRLPPADKGALRRLASFVHGLLYVLVIATVTLGLFNAWVRRDSLFGLLSLPKFPSSGSVLRERVQHLHSLAANLILVVAAFHATAALWHQYVRKDGLLARMVPALKLR